MSRTRLLGVLLVVGLLAVSIPLAIALAQGGSGTVTIRDSNDTNVSEFLSDMAMIKLMGLPALPPDKKYEGWFVSDDGTRKDSTGILMVDGDMVDLVYMSTGDNAGENLFGAFDKFVVTIEPDPDDDPGPSADVAMIDIIPAGGILHIRHLLYSLGGNPPYATGFHKDTPKGLVVGLREQAWTAALHARLSASQTTLAGVHQHAEHVVNIIEGTDGPNFGDLDGVGGAQNPGDGVGVLKYAEDTILHAELAARSAPDDPEIVSNSIKVVKWARQTWDMAKEARDTALATLATNDLLAAQVIIQNAQSTLDMAFNSSKQAYWSAQNMGIYAPKPPPPPEPEPTATPVPTATAVPPQPTPTPTPEAPKTGDTSVPHVALGALVAGVVILLLGIFIYRRSRVRA